MRKLLTSLVFTFLVCAVLPVLASSELSFQGPRLITYDLSLQERTYVIQIPVIYSGKEYAGAGNYKGEVEGRWINGKATETIIIHAGDKNSPLFKVVKTADCPQDPWITPNPVYNNLQKSPQVFYHHLWDSFGPLVAGNTFYSAALLLPTKSMLQTELAKKPPLFHSPAEGSQFQALHLVKLNIQKHPDYHLYLEYEYRQPGKASFAPLYVPRIHNKVENGESFVEDLSFIQPGEWRIRARTNNLTDAQPSPWLNLTVKPKQPVIVSPLHNATYQLKPNIGDNAKMLAIVPIKIEHNSNEIVHVEFRYRPNESSQWSTPSRTFFSYNSKRSEFVTEGNLTIQQAGIYRMTLCSDLVEGCIGREFTVVSLFDKLLNQK